MSSQNVTATISAAKVALKDVETPTSNIETPTSNIETPTSNIETPTSNIETPTSNIETPIPIITTADGKVLTLENLSQPQRDSIEKWYLDFPTILKIPGQGQKPDTSKAPGWKFGNNFEDAILVGYRSDTETKDPVYLKTDGWFTTPTDLTNCNPHVFKKLQIPYFDEKLGYDFVDISAAALAPTIKAMNDAKEAADEYSKIKIEKMMANRGNFGGKSRKHVKRRSKSKTKTKRRSKSKTKTKRRYRK